MRKVFLIAGFQNWGKTFLIESMFNNRKRFFYDRLYNYKNFDFCVQTQSNDDIGKECFEGIMGQRLSTLEKNGIIPTHICAAFCPTKEDNNPSDEIIKNLFPNDEVHIIAIEYKWCLHAKLEIQELRDYYKPLKNVTVHELNETNQDLKADALDKLLMPLL